MELSSSLSPRIYTSRRFLHYLFSSPKGAGAHINVNDKPTNKQNDKNWQTVNFPSSLSSFGFFRFFFIFIFTTVFRFYFYFYLFIY